MYVLLKQQLCLEFKSWFVKIGLLVLLFPGEYSSERLISLPSQAECNWNLWVVIKLRRMGWTQVCQKWISRQFWRNPNKWFHFIFLLSFFGVLEMYVDYFHLFGFCDVVFQTGLESQGWHTCTFLQFTLDKCYNKILQFFYFLHKIASEKSIVLNLEFDMKGTEHFSTVFSCYMYCVDLYVSKTFVYVYLCCYSQKRFIIWKENQIILSCASAVAPPLLGTAPNPQKRVGGSGCHCNRLYQVTHNLHKVTAKKP